MTSPTYCATRGCTNRCPPYETYCFMCKRPEPRGEPDYRYGDPYGPGGKP